MDDIEELVEQLKEEAENYIPDENDYSDEKN